MVIKLSKATPLFILQNVQTSFTSSSADIDRRSYKLLFQPNKTEQRHYIIMVIGKKDQTITIKQLGKEGMILSGTLISHDMNKQKWKK